MKHLIIYAHPKPKQLKPTRVELSEIVDLLTRVRNLFSRNSNPTFLLNNLNDSLRSKTIKVKDDIDKALSLAG